MKRLFAITTVVVLCSVFFFVVVCAAGPATPTRPTKGSWSGSTTTEPAAGDCALSGGVAEVSAEGTGVASPWGAGTWVGDPTCLFILIPAGSYVDGKQVFQGSGTATITTANGDEIYLVEVFTLIGNLVAPPGSATDAQGQWTQDIDLTGGTGRFTNAYGHAFSRGVWTNNNDGTLKWEGTHTGTIEY